MKFTKFLFPLVVLSLLISCSNNDDDTTNSEDGIVGSWTVTEIAYGGSSTTVVQGISSTATFTGVGFDMDLNIQFGENPNEYTTSGDYSILLTTEVAGQSFDSELTNEGFIGAGTWELSGDQLTVNTTTGETSVATIIEVDETTLKVAYSFMQTTTEQGAIVTYDVDGTYTFTRQ